VVEKKKAHRVLIVFSKFNSFLGEKLVEATKKALTENRISTEEIKELEVPGALEIPYATKKGILRFNPEVVITCGLIIRGETIHFDLIANSTTNELLKLSLDLEVPIINCILSTENVEQAIERTGINSNNKGYQAGLSAIEMLNLKQKLS